VARDLRVSVIDKCNLRCTYCMPAEGLPWLANDDLLTPEEIERLTRIFVSLGVSSIKLTGGEPTARREITEIVGRMRAIDAGLDLSMTTNGLALDRLAQPLREAGLDRVTISCDSLLRHRFAEITRRDALDKVMDGLRAAEEAGFDPVKVNCVVLAGTNDDEVLDFVRLARSTGHHVRFIEYMPLDAEASWERDKVMPSSKLLERIGNAFPLTDAGNGGPARRYRFADEVPGEIGFISSVTEPFCDSCDRVRITADGQFRSCLFALEETDLREPLRAGAPNSELEELIRSAVARKWSGHRIGHEDFVRPARSMSQIGG
jgi:GTP 3',8-cyclase